VSCPTCGRTKIDLPKLVREVSVLVDKYPALDLKLAVMGCIVNGPGEAREADLGIAGGVGSALLIKHGEVVGKIDEKDIVPVLDRELANWQ
jgi:(E)-4-hydroxy-3-methylbut-2-enyl-diphosphate synthase